LLRIAALKGTASLFANTSMCALRFSKDSVFTAHVTLEREVYLQTRSGGLKEGSRWTHAVFLKGIQFYMSLR
jgi:hypothetical protein